MAAKSLNFALLFGYREVQTIASPSNKMVFSHLVVHASFTLAPCRLHWSLPSQLEKIF